MDEPRRVLFADYVGADIVGRTIKAIHERGPERRPPRPPGIHGTVVRGSQAVVEFTDATWTLLRSPPDSYSFGEPGIFAPYEDTLYADAEFLIELGLVNAADLARAEVANRARWQRRHDADERERYKALKARFEPDAAEVSDGV